MPGFRLEPLVIELAAAFKRRGMSEHLAALRVYWRRRRGRPAPSPREWDHETVLGWLAVLRIPPFERVYPLLPEGSACPRCGGGRKAGVSHARVLHAWPGGWLVECADCRATWVCEGAGRRA